MGQHFVVIEVVELSGQQARSEYSVEFLLSFLRCRCAFAKERNVIEVEQGLIDWSEVLPDHDVHLPDATFLA